jgi:hypothetical protein
MFHHGCVKNLKVLMNKGYGMGNLPHGCPPICISPPASLAILPITRGDEIPVKKESLLTGTLDAVCSQIREEAASAKKSGKPAETILFDTFHTLVNFTMKYPALTRRISYLNTLENSSLHQCLQPVYDQITKLIDQAIADGSYRKTVPAGSIFETLLGIYYVILNHWNYRYPEDSDIISKKLRSKYDFHLKPYRPE